MQFKYQIRTDWPCLAWFATLTPGGSDIPVQHGSRVESHPDFFCEATWDGEFENADFDLTECVFGSGARIRGDRLTVVSSASVTDRLVSFHDGNRFYLSNSLVCLLTVLELQCDPLYPYYYDDIFSITRGINHYARHFATDRGDVILHYFRNLAWDNKQLHTLEKPLSKPVLRDFADYRNFMVSSLTALCNNFKSPGRNTTYQSVSNASLGYDSLAVSVLSMEIGNRDVISFEKGRSGYDDSGAHLIEQLGMSPVILDRSAWHQAPFSELPFLAADACGRDTIFYSARQWLNQRVLLSGYHGGAMWDRFGHIFDPDLSRKDNAGLSHTEFRLIHGYLHVPVPMLGATSVKQIQTINRSEEMTPWRLRKRFYDRPLPRRIIEEAGIDRDSFGTKKNAASSHLFSTREFERYIDNGSTFRDYMTWFRQVSRHHEAKAKYRPQMNNWQRIMVPMFRHLFPWALQHMRGYYDGRGGVRYRSSPKTGRQQSA